MPALTRAHARRPSAASDDAALCIDAGLCSLSIHWEGRASRRARLVIDERIGAFVSKPPADRSHVIDLALQPCDDEWLTYPNPRGASEPVATRERNGWTVQWGYYDLRIDGRRAHCRFVDREAGLEHALRAAAVFTSMPAHGLYAHAATLVVDGEAVLFAGHPNAGKSTISREGGADSVLSNEISIVEKRDGAWWALPSPFWGTGDTACPGTPVPLAAVATLRHGDTHTTWSRVSGASAVQALSPHIGVQAREQWDTELLLAVRALTIDVPCFDVAWKRGTDPFAQRPWKL